MIIYIPDITLSKIIEGVEGYEKNKFLLKQKYRKDEGLAYRHPKNKIECYKCGKKGHIKASCKVRIAKEDYSMIMGGKPNKGSLREEEVEINDFKRYCIFDSKYHLILLL
ncbi:hypothetical protein DMUE_2637 [Dictyocoela muelleri]|nr:hypothetical protein DMUE_2637 [Dictyocoela muelleri]